MRELTCHTLLTLSTDPNDFPSQLLPSVLKSVSTLLNGTRPQLRDVAAQVLNAVLGKKQFRKAVWSEDTCISG